MSEYLALTRSCVHTYISRCCCCAGGAASPAPSLKQTPIPAKLIKINQSDKTPTTLVFHALSSRIHQVRECLFHASAHVHPFISVANEPSFCIDPGTPWCRAHRTKCWSTCWTHDSAVKWDRMIRSLMISCWLISCSCRCRCWSRNLPIYILFTVIFWFS